MFNRTVRLDEDNASQIVTETGSLRVDFRAGIPEGGPRSFVHPDQSALRRISLGTSQMQYIQYIYMYIYIYIIVCDFRE